MSKEHGAHRPVILVVDNDPNVLDALSFEPKSAYVILKADSGDEALAIAKERDLDAIILDALLPAPGSVETLRQLKRMRPQTGVIFLSGVTDARMIVSGVREGAFDYILKPFDKAYLLEAVRRCIQLRLGETASALLVGAQPETLAATEVLLRRDIVASIVSLATAKRITPAHRPRFLVVDVPPAPTSAWRSEFDELHRMLSSTPTVLLCAADESAQRLRLPDTTLVAKLTRPTWPDAVGNELCRLFPHIVGDRRPPPRLPPPVTRAIDYLTEHYRQSFTVQDVAEASGLSESRLAHLFRETTRMTIGAFAKRVRIAVARYILSETGRSLYDIADSTGFSDASHFSRVFLAVEGQRPGEYRRTLGEGPAGRALGSDPDC